MEQIVDFLPRASINRLIFHPLERVITLRNNNTLGRVATALVIIGLFFAMATDGDLPLLWTRLLFGALVVFDVLMIDWLVR